MHCARTTVQNNIEITASARTVVFPFCFLYEYHPFARNILLSLCGFPYNSAIRSNSPRHQVEFLRTNNRWCAGVPRGITANNAVTRITR